MYPSSFNSTNEPRSSFYCENNYSSPPYSSFGLHSSHYVPFEEEAILGELFKQKQKRPSSDNHNHDTLFAPHEQSAMGKCSTSNGQLVKKDVHEEPRMRSSSKKDRHSKINTARGPRDRRMRLSLDVAKKFFKLQDMLGFDKASKTVEWLLMESKTAIQELFPRENRSSSLVGVSNSASSTSECEVLSGIDYQSVVKTAGDDQLTTKCKSSSSTTKEKKKTVRGVRKSSHPLAKETREKARARARERTMEKRSTKVGCGGGGDQYSKLGLCFDQDVTRLGNWNLFGENQVQTMNDQPETPSSHFQFKQPVVGENSSLMTTNWSPSLYRHNTEVSHEHQFNDFQMLSKL